LVYKSIEKYVVIELEGKREDYLDLEELVL
jgi:hypothetical protein